MERNLFDTIEALSRGEQVIDLWSKGLTGDQIAEATGYSRDSVFSTSSACQTGRGQACGASVLHADRKVRAEREAGRTWTRTTADGYVFHIRNSARQRQA